MKIRKIEKKMADTETLCAQLKADLLYADSTSYNGNEIRMRVKGELVTWELKAKKLWRYSDFVWTGSSERIYSFKYQGVFGGYMAFEIVGKEGPLFDMIQVR